MSWLWLEHSGAHSYLTFILQRYNRFIVAAPLYAELLEHPTLPGAHMCRHAVVELHGTVITRHPPWGAILAAMAVAGGPHSLTES
jgi:hypothetical protein